MGDSSGDGATGPTRDERVRGAMLASAVGDALGAPVEFQSAASIGREFGPGGVQGYDGGRGFVTDDTQMLLFTAEGIVRGVNRCIDRGSWGSVEAPVAVDRVELYRLPGVTHGAYLRWLFTQDRRRRSGSPDWLYSGWLIGRTELHERRAPGTTCLAALRSGVCGRIDEPINDSKGCGGVMRVAPIGLVAGDDAFRLAADAAAITHGHPTGWLASGALARIVERLVAGVALADAIDVALAELAEWDRHDETTAAIRAAVALAESTTAITPPAIERLGGGWIAEEALAISLYCALAGGDPAAALAASVWHSGDSDSTGAITGALLGAMLGDAWLPREWVDGLVEREVVETVAADLLAHVPDGAGTVAYDVDRYPPN